MSSKIERQSGSVGLPETMPETGADYAAALGIYDCGNLEHEFSAKLIRFKDLKGKFGRDGEGGRWYQGYLAELLAERILTDPALEGIGLLLPVPPKRGEDPVGYHLYDLVEGLRREMLQRGESGRIEIDCGALEFTGEVPPVKSIRLPDRPCALESRIACRRELAGRAVLLLDDIIASGATAAECIRAIRAAGAGRVALLALARRVG